LAGFAGAQGFNLGGIFFYNGRSIFMANGGSWWCGPGFSGHRFGGKEFPDPFADGWNFYPKDEIGWAGTPVIRAREYFPTQLKPYTDAQVIELMKNKPQWFELMYGYQSVKGKQLGNTQPGDGFKYLGRGFNGITGRYLYDRIGKAIGVDLINNPSRLNELPIAAAALAVYFTITLKGVLNKYGITDANKVKDLPTATHMAFQANAGSGTNIDTGPLRKEHLLQLENVKALYQLAISNPGKTAGGVVGVLALLTALFFLMRNRKKKKKK